MEDLEWIARRRSQRCHPGNARLFCRSSAARRRESLRGYAKRHGISEGALYQAVRALRRKGFLAPAGAKVSPTKNTVSRKTKFVEVKAAIPTPGWPAWQVRFPNGAILEGHSEIGSVLEALARI